MKVKSWLTDQLIYQHSPTLLPSNLSKWPFDTPSQHIIQGAKSIHKNCLIIYQNNPSEHFAARMLENIKWRWCAGRAVIWRQWTVSRCAWELEAGAAASDQEQELRRQWQWQIVIAEGSLNVRCTYIILGMWQWSRGIFKGGSQNPC